jgi:hypothetical protein
MSMLREFLIFLVVYGNDQNSLNSLSNSQILTSLIKKKKTNQISNSLNLEINIIIQIQEKNNKLYPLHYTRWNGYVLIPQSWNKKPSDATSPKYARSGYFATPTACDNIKELKSTTSYQAELRVFFCSSVDRFHNVDNQFKVDASDIVVTRSCSDIVVTSKLQALSIGTTKNFGNPVKKNERVFHFPQTKASPYSAQLP